LRQFKRSRCSELFCDQSSSASYDPAVTVNVAA
jgi:hypothetical protein